MVLSSAKRLLIPELLFPEEHAELLRWAQEMEPHLTQNGLGRRFQPVLQLPSRPHTCRRVRQRIQEQLDIDLMTDPAGPLGWYLSVISNGGEVHPFLEALASGRRYVRCILLLQEPAQGGLLRVGDGVVPMKERDLLVFSASKDPHAVSRVGGPKSRISLNFGYEVENDHLVPGLDAVN